MDPNSPQLVVVTDGSENEIPLVLIRIQIVGKGHLGLCRAMSHQCGLVGRKILPMEVPFALGPFAGIVVDGN